MSTIIAGQIANLLVTVQKDGAAVAIDPTSVVKATLYSPDGLTVLIAEKTIAAGAGWPNGVVAVSYSAMETALAAGEAMLVLSSTVPSITKRFRVVIETATGATRSSLFVKDIIVDEIRADRLLMAAGTMAPGVTLTDDYIWDKVRAAESAIAHELRVFLVPTTIFPDEPTADELAALNGKPWAVEPGYDYEPVQFQSNFGMIVLRQKPVQEVTDVRFVYPSQASDINFHRLPVDWVRIDKKYAQLQFVPATSAFLGPLTAFMMQAFSSGRGIPLAIKINYVAGLENAYRDYPELIDAIKKAAVLKMIEDAFLPQSGSISADGLSQSMSVDMEKYHSTIDTILNGPKGSNGGLMAAIHGVRSVVMGG